MDVLGHWLAAYALQSTLLLGVLALAQPWCARLATETREGLWRAALLLPLVGAGLQTAGLGRGPLLRVPLPEAPDSADLPGRASLAGGAPPAAAPDRRGAPEPERVGTRASEVARRARPLRSDRPQDRGPVASDGGTALLVDGRGDTDRAGRSGSAALALLALVLGALLPGLGLVRLVVERRGLGQLLGRRSPAPAAWRARLEELRRRAGLRAPVELTVSPRLASPVALGPGPRRRAEVCVPERLLADGIDASLVEAALAHELAHIARRDPAWLGLGRAVARLLPWQPLNRVALGELAVLAELGADGRAAAWTGDRLALARCLTEVAGWVRTRPAAVGPVGLLRRPAGLEQRVRRLLDGSSETPRRGTAKLAVLGALALAPVLPGIGAANAAPADPVPGTTDTARTDPARTDPAMDDPALWRGRLAGLARELRAIEEDLAPLAPADRARLARRAGTLTTQLEQLGRALEAHPDHGPVGFPTTNASQEEPR